MNLQDLTGQYIVYKRSLGLKFRGNGFYLEAFCKLTGADTPVELVDRVAVDRFLYRVNRKITTGWFRRYNALKGLFQYAKARGYVQDIPLQEELPKHISDFTPYIYPKHELRLLLETALSCKRPKSFTGGITIRMMLLITYSLGLRKMETVSIRLRDIDLKESLVIISSTKFYKTRMVTFNWQIKKELENYLLWRKSKGLSQTSESYLFLNDRGKPVSGNVFYDSFEKIRAKSGIRRDDGAYCQPRIHDLRHTFAVNRLTLWYKENKDVQTLLPVLSTYMGHVQLSQTSVYLTMTDDLLQEANIRFENYIKQNNHED
jgi:integrase